MSETRKEPCILTGLLGTPDKIMDNDFFEDDKDRSITISDIDPVSQTLKVEYLFPFWDDAKKETLKLSKNTYISIDEFHKFYTPKDPQYLKRYTPRRFKDTIRVDYHKQIFTVTAPGTDKSIIMHLHSDRAEKALLAIAGRGIHIDQQDSKPSHSLTEKETAAILRDYFKDNELEEFSKTGRVARLDLIRGMSTKGIQALLNIKTKVRDLCRSVD